MVFCGGGFRAEPGLYGDCGAGTEGTGGEVRPYGAGARERNSAQIAVPGADPAGDAVSRRGGTGGRGDAEQATGGAVPPGGGRDGGGQAGGGPTAAGRAGCDPDAGDDHGRAGGDDGPRVLPGAEAGPDHRATGAVAARGVADRGGAEVWAEAGGRADGSGSEGIAGGERAIRGLARGEARRPGVRSGAGVLERGEGVPEPAARE